MRTYWRLMGFAKPIEKYAIPYFFYTLLHAIFNTFTFVMIMPMLDTLFSKEAMVQNVTQMPKFGLNMGFFKDFMNFQLYNIYGENYDVMQVLMLLAAVIVVASLLSNLFRYLGQRVMEEMKITTLRKIRNNVFDNVMGLHVGYFTNERKGDIISKITSDVQVVQFCITNTLQVVFREPFLIFGYMFALLKISVELTVFTVLFLPLVALVIGTIVKKLRKQATAGQQTYAEMVSTLDESLSGIKVIKAYNALDYIKDKFHAINKRYSRIMWSMAKRQQLSSPVSEFLGISAMAVLLIFGGSLVLKGSLSAAGFITYVGIFSQVTRPVRAFADAFSNINQGIAAGERVLDLLDTKNEITNSPDAITMHALEDGLEFRDVRFSYGSKEIIRGVNFSVKKGETIALVGPSGGGKSTIADLLPRFYDVQSGAITIDGNDIRNYSIESLRSHIGVVSQDTILFNDTIEGNIRMGKRDATMEEIVAAAKVANAHEFILETENGYETNIGDRGIKLSGGQRQRLSIARAVLKNPDLLILDEATSALDTESEKLVQDALDHLLKGRTSIIVAHRLSTIYGADKIVVIDQGEIVEQGTHQQLIDKDGVYCKLVNLQSLS